MKLDLNPLDIEDHKLVRLIKLVKDGIQSNSDPRLAKLGMNIRKIIAL